MDRMTMSMALGELEQRLHDYGTHAVAEVVARYIIEHTEADSALHKRAQGVLKAVR